MSYNQHQANDVNFGERKEVTSSSTINEIERSVQKARPIDQEENNALLEKTGAIKEISILIVRQGHRDIPSQWLLPSARISFQVWSQVQPLRNGLGVQRLQCWVLPLPQEHGIQTV